MHDFSEPASGLPARARTVGSDGAVCAIEAPAAPLIFHPASTVIAHPRIRRESIRPPQFRGPDFAAKHDDTTLFFDVFRSRRSDTVVFLGPPFYNLTPFVEDATVTAYPKAQPCSFVLRHLDRLAELWVRVPEGTESISFRSQLGEFEVAPRPNRCDFFSGKRVLFTLSKNNRPEWIRDWMRYHRDVHGANAVLIYDGSTDYTPHQLALSLGQVSGFDRVCVVDWPFKYGAWGIDTTRFWDSNYCQPGGMEHARRMFLETASSVMNGDVDELVVSTGRRSVFEAAERSWRGFVRYYGIWVPVIEGRTRIGTTDAPIRHRDFDCYLAPPPQRKWGGLLPDYSNRCPTKWTVVPSRCPDTAQWLTHFIANWPGRNRPAFLTTTQAFTFRHFRGISTGWNEDRSFRERFDPARHVLDKDLLSHFTAVNWEQ